MRLLPDPSPTHDERPPHHAAEIDTGTLHALDDRTLLGLMLSRVVDPSSVHVAAERLFDRFGSLGDIAAADPPELRRAGGLAPAAILDLKLLRQFSLRLARAEASHRPVLSSSAALNVYLRTALAHLPREQFRTLFLDSRNVLMRDELLSEGTVNHAPVYPREVVRRALELSASSLILVHNHPSGDPTPSQADIAVTRQIVDAARLLGLQVHDHIVVGRTSSASLRALGLM